MKTKKENIVFFWLVVFLSGELDHLLPPEKKIRNCPKAEGKYHEFLEGAGRWRYDVWRTLLERDQTRQMLEALTQRVFVESERVPFVV